MEQVSKFYSLMDARRTAEAAALLMEEIHKAHFVNPRDDYTWGVEADLLAYRILAERGPAAFVDFHQELLALFLSLESQWGHLHKGHLYFRIGLGMLAEDVGQAQVWLEKALAEDCLLSESMLQPGSAEDAGRISRSFPSYITLAMLERMQAWPFPGALEQHAFFAGLAGARFDVVWDRKEVDPKQVERALRKLVSLESLHALFGLKYELDRMARQDMSYALRAGLEGFLLGFLRAMAEPQLPSEQRLGARTWGLWRWLEEAGRRSIFPSTAVWSVFQMVPVMDDAMDNPSLGSWSYAIDEEAGKLIALCMKILLDRALVDWSTV